MVNYATLLWTNSSYPSLFSELIQVFGNNQTIFSLQLYIQEIYVRGSEESGTGVQPNINAVIILWGDAAH